RFEVAIIVVVADKKQLQRTLRSLQLVFQFSGERCGIANKLVPVKAVMNHPNFILRDFSYSVLCSLTRLPLNPGVRPPTKLGGEWLAGRYGYGGPVDRPLGERPS